MRILWNEYAGMILGTVGAIAVMGIVTSLLLSEGRIYEVLMTFSKSIC